MPLRITKLSARNMQGQTFSDDLAAVTLICGDNARGKTTRINTVHLVLAGYAPGISQKGHDIFSAFATGNPLQVSGVLERDGQIVQQLVRSWTEQRGSVKYDGPAPDQWTPMPPVSIDADAYFGLSGPERTRFIFAQAPLPAELTIENIAKSLTANAKNIKIEENTPETEAAIASIVELISDTASEISSGTLEEGVSVDANAQTFVDSLASQMRDHKNLADQNVKRLDKTVQGLAQVREAGASAPQDAEVRLTECRMALDTANGNVARLLEVGKALRRELDEATAQSAGAVDQSDILKQISEIELNLPVKIEPAGEHPKKPEMGRPRPTIQKEESAHNDLLAKVRDATRDLADATAEMKRLEKAVEDAKKQTVCPTCGHDITAKQKKVVAELNKQLRNASGTCVNRTTALAFISSNEQDSQSVLEKASQAVIQWDNEWRALDEKFTKDFDAWEKQSRAFEAYSTQLIEREKRLNVLRGTLTNTAAAEAAAKLPKLQAEVVKVREEYNSVAQIAIEKKNAVTAAEAAYKLLLQERASATDRARVIGESVKARAELAVLKQAVEMVLELQTKLVEAAVGPIVDSCNRLCAGVLQHPLVYRDGEIGINSPAGFVTHKTMSGAERTLVRCAVSLALAAGAPLKLAILDEMGRLSSRNKKLVTTNVIKLVLDGEIDQAILVDTDEKDYAAFSREFGEHFAMIRV